MFKIYITIDYKVVAWTIQKELNWLGDKLCLRGQWMLLTEFCCRLIWILRMIVNSKLARGTLENRLNEETVRQEIIIL